MNYRRKPITTSIDQDLWLRIKIIADTMNKRRYTRPNDLVEIGLEYVIKEYEQYLPDEYKLKEGVK
jgi:hypothetical protein